MGEKKTVTETARFVRGAVFLFIYLFINTIMQLIYRQQ